MYHPLCRICQHKLPLSKSLIVSSDRSFCKEHSSQYKTRQRNGVMTSELDDQWLDSLDNWRERPIELDHEIGKKPFSSLPFFHLRYEDWLLFMRSYIVRNGQKTMAAVILTSILQSLHRNRHTVILKANKRRKSRRRYQARLGDALAVNTRTGEIRRFVDVSQDVVMDDLEGIRPAPYQTEIAHLWGDPDPTGIEERFNSQYLDDNHRVLISALVHLADFPIYGLIGNPFELSLCSLGTSGGVWHGITQVSFAFSSPLYPNERGIFTLDSAEPRERNLIYYEDLDIENLFQCYRQLERAQFGPPSTWEGAIIIAGTTFSGTIHFWSQPQLLALFRLKGEKTIISGHSFGLAYDDLLQLFKTAQPINEHDQILAQYQREADAEIQRL
jgi:hypothetical protein